jgi:iron complex outermembrane recepter protein
VSFASGVFTQGSGSAGAAKDRAMGAFSTTSRSGAAALAALLSSAAWGGAMAQSVTLPDINVTSSRLSGVGGIGRPSGTEPAPGTVQEAETVSGILFGAAGITGASTTVITAEEIAQSPSMTVQDILAREAGVQVQSLYGSVNGAHTTIDLRGFGSTAQSNTLILINGRRLNDVDMAAVDLSAIPQNGIERIEITRGNSGAVLYGDNAVGGVVNIVIKSGVNLPPSARVEVLGGSYGYREGRVSGSTSSGPYSASVYGNAITSDGYRVNNHLNQKNAVGDLRYTTEHGSWFLNLSGDDQRLGFPGPRNVNPLLGIDQMATDRRGTGTPRDYGDKQGYSATGGFTHMLTPDIELIVDGGWRRKDQQAGFFSPFQESYVNSTLSTYSLTPRMKINTPLFGLPSRIITGLDYYDSSYDSDRSQFSGFAPIHQYKLGQSSLGGYWQQTVSVLPTTDLSGGIRVQRTKVNARDQLDLNAPGAFPVVCFPPFGCFGDTQGIPLDQAETNQAYHVGFEHRFNPVFSVFGRAAQAFRTPNVDERVGMAPNGTPTNFNLKTQTSHDMEAGVRFKYGRFALQSSVYQMKLENELMFNPVTFINYNLDPTQRRGVETIMGWQITDDVRLKGSLTYIDATFREGINAGNQVPLVSPWTGSIGVTWNIYKRHLMFDGVVRYMGERRMDNDQANFQPQIPAATLVDVRLGGELDQFFWAVSIENLFNEMYFDYAVASANPLNVGVYNAYPLPGRTFMLRAGMKW